MKLKQTLFTLLALLPLAASAHPESDVDTIRALLPAGHDIAQVQASIQRGTSEEQALEAAKANYLIGDFNKDGRNDFFVIAEQNPTYRNWDTDQPCEKYDPENQCDFVYGPRYLQLFYGQKDGTFRLAVSNQKAVLQADEGGVFGDPLEGLTVNKKGTVELSFYGGSAWRWSNVYKFQFRHDDFYLVGRTFESMWTGDLRFERKDENLLTGLVIEQKSKGEGHQTHTKKYKVPVKPLVKMSEFDGNNE